MLGREFVEYQLLKNTLVYTVHNEARKWIFLLVVFSKLIFKYYINLAGSQRGIMWLFRAPPLRSFYLNLSYVSPFFANSFENLSPGSRAWTCVWVAICFPIGINLEVFTNPSEELGALQSVYFKSLKEHSVHNQQHSLWVTRARGFWEHFLYVNRVHEFHLYCSDSAVSTTELSNV